MPSDSRRGSRKQGFNLIHDHLYTDGVVQPRLHVFESCNNLINEMVRAVTNDSDIEDMDDSSPDHAIDCLRYMLMYLNNAYMPEKVKEVDMNSWNAAFEDYDRKDDERKYARGNAA